MAGAASVVWWGVCRCGFSTIFFLCVVFLWVYFLDIGLEILKKMEAVSNDGNGLSSFN